MELSSLAIPFGFIVLAAILCWLFIGGIIRWWIKLLTVIAVPAYGLAVWSSLATYKGWATSDVPPEKAVMFWVEVREPNEMRNDEGAVFVWLLPDKGAKPDNPLAYIPEHGEPRAYRLKYSRKLHEKAASAQEAIRMTGQPMQFSRAVGGKHGKGKKGRPEPNSSEPRGGREGDGIQSPEGSDLDPDEGVEMYLLPPPSQTPKE